MGNGASSPSGHRTSGTGKGAQAAPVDAVAHLKLTRLLGVVERPEGGCFLVNPLCFSPVRVDGPRAQVETFVDALSREGARGLEAEAVDFLASHRILVDADEEERAIRERSADQHRPAQAFQQFTIRLGAPVSRCDGLRGSLARLLGQLQAAPGEEKAPEINMKLIWDASCDQGLGACLGELIAYARAQTQNTAGVACYGEFPIEALPDALGELKRLTQPSPRMNCIVSDGVSADQGAALMTLIDEGFRPHCIFRVSAGAGEQVAATIGALADGVVPDAFTFAAVPMDRREFATDAAFAEALPRPDEMLELCDFCHALPNVDLAQSWLYQDVYTRVTRPGYVFPCRACVGRAAFVDAEGKWSGCHLAAVADPAGRRDDPSTLLNTAEPTPFGGSRFAEERCSECAVRYACGGICPYAALGVCDADLETRVFELHCAMRRHVILRFFEDATALVSHGEPQRPAYRFVSGQGRLALRPIGES